jgi:hypothetical protein
MKNLFFLFFLQFCGSIIYAQLPVGAWRDHLCYSNVKKVIKVDEKIYCATEQNLFVYNTSDNSLQKLSTITGLSDMGVCNLAYYNEKKILLITYSNGNIDLINNNKITNIPDLKNKVINTKKGANYILFNGDYAYLCYDFGILVVDLLKNEIKDTYIIGEPGIIYPVNSLIIVDGYFYAATDKGIFKALVTNPYLVDYNQWQRQTNISSPSRKFGSIHLFQNKLIVNSVSENANGDTLYILNNSSWNKLQNIGYNQIKEITTTENHIVVTGTGNVYAINQNFQTVYNFNRFSPQSAISDNVNLWIGDYSNGLMKQPLDGSEFTYYYPQGPGSNYVWNIKAHGNSILVTAGGVNASWVPIYIPGMVFKFQDNSWFNIWNANAKDYISICGDPDDPDKFYIGSWGNGVFVYKNNELIENYTDQNSSIQNVFAGEPYMFIGGITFDSDKNMWLTNELVSSPVSVRIPVTEGTTTKYKWKSYRYGSYIDVSTIGDILSDIYGNYWIVLPRTQGLFIFNTNNTIEDESDDNVLRFRPKDAYKESVGDVFCAVNDRDGTVWVGTDHGALYYSNPAGVLSGETDGYQPTIPRNDGTIYGDALLNGESVHCIAVDGSNRKWMGTEKGGAFLVSADGTKQILHFNTDNSPLFSNFVRAIAIHPKTGEVFFGTDKGIISYRGNATEPEGDLSKAYAFPNPVRPDYHGNITITGLVENTSVKITDISGNLVYQTSSQGGTATWDGKNRKGNKASTGVYLVFLTNEDGTLTNVIKLLIIK